MPIKPENKNLYPADWPEIRERIRTRAGDRCELCGLRNHSVGFRDENGKFIPCGGNLIMEDYGNGIDYKTGKVTEYKRAKEVADFQTDTDEYGNKYIVIVCTTAHMDHDPTNCGEKNLKFLCQKCHNKYDMPHRKETRRAMKLKNQAVINFDNC